MLHFASEKGKVILPEYALVRAGKLPEDVHGLEHSGTVRGKISVENRKKNGTGLWGQERKSTLGVNEGEKTQTRAKGWKE